MSEAAAKSLVLNVNYDTIEYGIEDQDVPKIKQTPEKLFNSDSQTLNADNLVNLINTLHGEMLKDDVFEKVFLTEHMAFFASKKSREDIIQQLFESYSVCLLGLKLQEACVLVSSGVFSGSVMNFNELETTIVPVYENCPLFHKTTSHKYVNSRLVKEDFFTRLQKENPSVSDSLFKEHKNFIFSQAFDNLLCLDVRFSGPKTSFTLPDGTALSASLETRTAPLKILEQSGIAEEFVSTTRGAANYLYFANLDRWEIIKGMTLGGPLATCKDLADYFFGYASQAMDCPCSKMKQTKYQEYVGANILSSLNYGIIDKDDYEERGQKIVHYFY